MKLQLTADKVTIRGARVDGSYVVSLELGEYMKSNIAELLAQLDNEAVVQVTIEQNSDE